MALSIKTDEADRLARRLARLRGETITEAVTVALREQCAREEAKPRTYEERLAAIEAAAAEFRRNATDLTPVTKEEWDAINDDVRLMVIDSSAIMAVLLGEADAARIAQRIAAERQSLISAANYVEAGQVYAQRQRLDPEVSLARYQVFLDNNRIEIEPVDEAQARLALTARIKYGRGFGHPARLNYSDCFAYALAKSRGLPLLYKGDDFTHTDIVPALV